MELAARGLFRAKWTNEIHDEWIRNLLKNRVDLNEERLLRTRDLMNQAVMDSVVEGYEELIAALSLPDPNDRHVLAAAIKCGADAIVTFNRKDFPLETLQNYELEHLHPDEFLLHQFGLDNAQFLTAALACRKRLKAPPKTSTEYLDRLEAQGLPLTVAELRPFASIL